MLLSAFLLPGSPPDVLDPYYGGDQGFETVLNMIEHACEPLLRHCSRADARRVASCDRAADWCRDRTRRDDRPRPPRGLDLFGASYRGGCLQILRRFG